MEWVAGARGYRVALLRRDELQAHAVTGLLQRGDLRLELLRALDVGRVARAQDLEKER